MPLRIGFDLDGVLADMEGELIRQAEQLFGGSAPRRRQRQPAASANKTAESVHTSTPQNDPTEESLAKKMPALRELDITPRQERRLWRHVRTIENFWQTLPEIEAGAISRLAALATNRRWEVIFLTKRPKTAGSTAQLQSQRWLESKGFGLPSVFVVQGSRGRIAASLDLDVIVDDRLENCLEVVTESRARAILVWRAEADQVPANARRLGIGVVNSVDDCLNVLLHLDSPVDKPRMLDRAMQLLGLKQSAEA